MLLIMAKNFLRHTLSFVIIYKYTGGFKSLLKFFHFSQNHKTILFLIEKHS